MRKVLRSGTWLVSVDVILVFLTACMDSEASSPEEAYVAPSGSDSATAPGMHRCALSRWE